MSTTDSHCCERASRVPREIERLVWSMASAAEQVPSLICDLCYMGVSIDAAIVQLRLAQNALNASPPTWSTRKPEEQSAWHVEGAISFLCDVPAFGLSYGPRKDKVSA